MKLMAIVGLSVLTVPPSALSDATAGPTSQSWFSDSPLKLAQ
jgi:hypothetical protein